MLREMDSDRHVPDDLYVRRPRDSKVDPETFNSYVKSSIDLYNTCVQERGLRGCLYGLRIYYNTRVRFSVVW